MKTMKRQLSRFEEFFADDFADERQREAYREVTAEELGEILRYLREKRGLTQKQLADQLGYRHRSRISQIEGTEGMELSLETLARYANALGYRLELHFVDKQSGEVAARYFLDHMDEVAEEETWRTEQTPRSWVTFGKQGSGNQDEFVWAA